MESGMDEKREILSVLMDAVGEDECGVSCENATLYKDTEGWQLMLGCFMGPWNLGRTVEEARASIHQYASMTFWPGVQPDCENASSGWQQSRTHGQMSLPETQVDIQLFKR